jgi:regulator of protease activity HflC (stomatin/prohibitin superfamily)
MFYLLAVLVALVLLAVVALVLFPWLAEENVLFTTVKEGTVKTIMRGDSLDYFIMSFAEYHLNDPSKDWYNLNQADWEVIYHGKGKGNQYDDRPWLLRYLGLYWIGWIWRASVYVYQFEWNETYTDKDSGEEKVLTRDEPTDFIYVADFTYAIKTVGAETQDRLPTDELTLVTVAIRNPYRALFSGEDWMRRVTAAINRNVRTFVGNKNFQDIISTKDFTAFSADIIKLSKKLPDDPEDPNERPPHGLQGKYGAEIRTADLQTIELSGDAKKQDQEATTLAYFAEQKAVATKLAGDADAYVIEVKGGKEAEALRTRLAVIKDHGEAGIALAGYDAVVESSKGPGKTIIWANNPLAPLAGLLKPETKKGEL